MPRRPLLAAAMFMLLGARIIHGQTLDATAPATVAAPQVKPDAVKPDASAAKLPHELPTSIFFSPEEQQRIRAALIAYEKSKLANQNNAESKANDFLNQLTDSEPKKPEAKEEKIFVYPQFFLNSLVYHTPDDWVVLVNNQRYSAKIIQENQELKVTDVDNEKVSLEWKPKKLDKVMESWAKGANNEVGFDRVTGIVTFTLRPNQTFSSYAMRVVEGKLIPYAVNLRPNDPADAAAGDSDADKAAKNAADKKDENITTDDMKNDVGVKALDKTYKRIGLGD